MGTDGANVMHDADRSPKATKIAGVDRDARAGQRPAVAARDSLSAGHTVPPSTRAARKRQRKKKGRRLLILVLLPLLAAGAGWSWYSYRAPGAAEPAVATATVTRRDFSSSVLATGAVQPQVGAEVRVGARLSGKVERLYANIGDAVIKGQVVAELEQADLEAVVAQRQAELELARAKLASVQSLLPKEIEKAGLDVEETQAAHALARKQLDREAWLQEQEATSDNEYDEAEQRCVATKTQLEVARKKLELAELGYAEQSRQAEAEVERARSALRNAEIQLSYATIRAPIDGVIASVATQEGETVAAGMQAPTFVTIIDLKRLQVDAYVDEVDIGKVQVGQEARFTVDAFPGREFRGRVTAIYPNAVIQDNVVNYDVVITILDEHQGLLRPEMTASVTILLEQKSGVLAIPAKAVKREQGKNVVYLARDGRPEMREITVGWKDGQWIEVLGGLEEDQTIFLQSPTEVSRNPAP
jgi:multidrug efflux pump subunit AcrA (membrane-fusion protein)